MQTAFVPTHYESFGSTTSKCLSCQREHKVIVGAVFDQDDEPLALFGASPQEHPNKPRLVHLRLGLKAEDESGQLLEPKDFSLILINKDGQVGTSVVDGFEERELTRDEALKSPYISLVYAIDDFIVANEPEISLFLGTEVKT